MTNKERLSRMQSLIWLCIILAIIYEISLLFFKGKNTETDRILYAVFGAAAAVLYAIQLAVKIIINKEKE